MRYLRYALLGLLAMAALLVSVPQGLGAHINPTVVATVPVGNVLVTDLIDKAVRALLKAAA